MNFPCIFLFYYQTAKCYPFFLQYYSAWSNYEEAIKYLVTVPKYRIQATEIAKNDGLLKRDKKLDKGKTKEQIKEEDEKVTRYFRITTVESSW